MARSSKRGSVDREKAKAVNRSAEEYLRGLRKGNGATRKNRKAGR